MEIELRNLPSDEPVTCASMASGEFARVEITTDNQGVPYSNYATGGDIVFCVGKLVCNLSAFLKGERYNMHWDKGSAVGIALKVEVLPSGVEVVLKHPKQPQA